MSLRMVTPQVGWAVRVDGNGYPVGVVRTTDGGRVWRDTGPPGLRGQRLSAAFSSATDAWLTWNPGFWGRPVIYRTIDGGVTWSRMGRLPMAVLGASAPDMVTGQLGWVGAGLGVAGGSSGMAIFRTTDGGQRWRLAELTSSNRQTPGAVPFSCDKGLAGFSSVTTGWVTGTCAGGPPTFWVSHDGGWSWRRQPLPRPSGHGLLASCSCFITGPVFTSPQDGALWASDLPGPPGQAQAAYLTRDGGRTWAPLHLPGGRVPLQIPDFIDGAHGFVLGGRLADPGQPARDVRLFATMDGGVTWTARLADPLLGQAILDMVTPAAGFATWVSYGPLRPHLLETRNGGATWTGVPASAAATRRPAPVSPHTSTANAPPCSARSLTLGYGPALSPATGEHGDTYVLTNRGPAVCTLAGYPRITLYTADGALLPFHYTHGHSQYVTSAPPQTVVLPPGASAYVLAAKYRCDLGNAHQATTIRITVPGPQPGAVTGRAASSTLGVSALAYCRGGPNGPGQIIAVSPLERTRQATFPR